MSTKLNQHKNRGTKDNERTDYLNWIKLKVVKLWRNWSRDCVQKVIAISTTLTLIVLILNLYYFWKQVDLTQILNQPICAVKELKVDKVRDNVVQISPVIKNFGKIAERNASFEWKINIVENLNNPQKRKITEVTAWSKKDHIKILPEQEFIGGFRQYTRDDFNNMVRGYDSAILVSMIIGYHDLENKPQRYSCSYLITRLANLKEDKYEVMLNEAQ